jgi:hypothetical protein
MKIIKIESCGKCPYRYEFQHYAYTPKYTYCDYPTEGATQHPINATVIDPACPLEDYKEPENL